MSENLNILRALYNEKNTLLKEEDVIKILKKGGIHRASEVDLTLWQQVFIHRTYTCNANRSYAYTHIQRELEKQKKDETLEVDVTIPKKVEEMTEADMLPLFPDSYERLEWLGDSILQSISSQYLFTRYPNEPEGFLTKLRSRMVRTQSLAKCSRYLGLDRHIIMSRDVENLYNGRINNRILEDVFEAWVGALFLAFGQENGYNLCQTFLYNVFDATMDLVEMIYDNTNYKDRLMQFYQKNFNGAFPMYIIDSEILREDGLKEYTVSVTDPYGKKLENFTATSKRIAEKMAAKKALFKYDMLEEHETVETVEDDEDDDE